MATSGEATHERLFSALRPSIRKFAERGVVRSFRKNTILIQEGESGDSTFVLLQGRVKVYSNDLDGHEIIFNTVEAGDYFAEMWLDGGPRSASVVTLEPCICAIVSRAALRDHLASDPDFVMELLGQVIRRLRTATSKVRELALKDVYGRVVSVLEGKGAAAPDAPVVLKAVTHQNLASQVGSSREMVSRLLKELERGGYVALGVRSITLLRKLPARF